MGNGAFLQSVKMVKLECRLRADELKKKNLHKKASLYVRLCSELSNLEARIKQEIKK